MRKPENVIRIPTSLEGDFFRYWFEFLQPFHKLTSREMDILVALVKHRYELSKVIKDEEILDRVTMSEDTKRKVREECKVSIAYFQAILSKLRKNNIIVDNKINPKYIPNIVEKDGNFLLLLWFQL